MSDVSKAASRVPMFVLASFLRSLFNAWNTGTRYGKPGPCKWCGMVFGDSLGHYLVCMSFLSHAEQLFPGLLGSWCLIIHPPCLPVLMHGALLIGLQCPASGPTFLLAHDLLHFAFCEAKHNNFEGDWRSLFKACARVWRQYCLELAELLASDRAGR